MPELVPIPSPGIPLEYGEVGDPLVVVLHDKYGRLPWLEPFAAALADRGGFRVLVPDFYDGVATTDGDDAAALMARLTDEDARDILDAAIGQGLDEGSPAGRPGRLLDGRRARPARGATRRRGCRGRLLRDPHRRRPRHPALPGAAAPGGGRTTTAPAASPTSSSRACATTAPR